MKKKIFTTLIAALLSFAFAFAIGCKPDGQDDGTKKPPKITDGDVCIGLEIVSMPKKTEYKHGEKFNPVGLIFDAVYENGFDGDKNLNAGDLDGWVPMGPLTSDVTEIILKFEDYEKAIPVTVVPKILNGIKITREPDIKAYSAGDMLDLTGLTVSADYEEGLVENETGYTITDASGKAYEQGTILEEAVKELELTVSLRVGEITKTDRFTIKVDTLIKVQAENCVESGAEKPTDKCYTVISGKKPSDVIKTDSTFTGTGYLGNISKGVKVDFYIYSEEYVKNADLVLVASSTRNDSENKTMLDCQFNKLYRVFVGDGDEREEIYIGDDVILKGKPHPSESSGSSKWTNWADVSFGSVELKKGFNRVTVECIGSEKDADGKNDRTPNIDRLDVRLSATPDSPARGDECVDIIIKKPPEKLEYKAGEKFTAAGIVFDAVYKNGYEGDKGLTYERLSWQPSGALTSEDAEVTLKFRNFEKTINISVTERVITGVEITREPDTKVYMKGGALNLGGMIVKALYDDGEVPDAKNYTVTDFTGNVYENGTALTALGEIELIVSITSGGATKSAKISVNVYDGMTVQAEAVLGEGVQRPTDSSYTVISGLGNINASQGSGNGCVENVAVPVKDGDKQATKIEFFIYSDGAVSGAELVFTLASTNNNNTGAMGDMQFNRMFKVTVGDGEDAKELFVGDGVFVKGKPIPTGVSRWFLWDEVAVGVIDLKAGFTKVTLECVGQIVCDDGSSRAANVDKLDIRFGAVQDIRGKQVQSVEIASMPKYLHYGAGAKFTAEGLKVKAVYEGDILVSDVKNYSIQTAENEAVGEGYEFKNTGAITLYAVITEGGVTLKASFTVNVGAGNSISVQAEATVTGEAPTNESYAVISGKHKFEQGNGLNGTAAVSDIDKGTKIEFRIYSDKAVKGAELMLVAASLDRGSGKTNDSQFNKIFALYADGEKVNTPDSVKIAGRTLKEGERIWFVWTENLIARVDLNEGYTVITLECIGKITDSADKNQRSANLDMIEIKF